MLFRIYVNFLLCVEMYPLATKSFYIIHILGSKAIFQILSPEREEMYYISAKQQKEGNIPWTKKKVRRNVYKRVNIFYNRQFTHARQGRE